MNSLHVTLRAGRVLLLKAIWILLLFGVAATKGIAQTATPAPGRDAPAVALLKQAVQALNDKTIVSDVSLDAVVTKSVGPNAESGTGILQAKAGQKSRVRTNVAVDVHEEVRNGRMGVWSAGDGQKHLMALHNCWVEAAWFFPGLALQLALDDPEIRLVYLGQENRAGVVLQHVLLFRVPPSEAEASSGFIQKLSGMDVYLDAASSLPLAFHFTIHADADANVDLPVEILFGNYQATGGVRAPLHIQKLVQETLVVDFNITAVSINSGLSDAEFTFSFNLE